MFTLIAIGVGVAFLFSVAALLFPSAFPEAFRGENGQVADYFEAAGVIVTLVLVGPGVGTPRSQPNQRRDQSAARIGSENGPAGA